MYSTGSVERYFRFNSVRGKFEATILTLVLIPRPVARVPQQRILFANVQEVSLRRSLLGSDSLGQDDVEVADGDLGRLAAPGLWVAHERYPAGGLDGRVLDADGEGKPVLAEGLEHEPQLVAALRHRDEVAAKLEVLRLPFQDLTT